MPAISGATRLAAVIGDPVRHSLSPIIHNAAFVATDLDWVYVAFDVPAGRAGDALDAMRQLGIGGLSVTMPHKTEVARAVESRSDAVAVLDAANCVVARPDGLRGENTDGEGFLAGLAVDAGFDVADRRVLVIGAGGAARAVVYAVAGAGAASICVHNRSAERAQAAAALAGTRGCVVDLVDLGQYDLIVNATPVGMAGPLAATMPCATDELHSSQLLVDLIYQPTETLWVRTARARGVEAYNGVSMLVGQAAVAFEHWTGLAAPVQAMTSAVRAELVRQSTS